MTWTPATTLVDLDSGAVVFKHGSKQLAIFRVNTDIHAIDNRCPHEGYPLSEGSVEPASCLLTCNWHNWKFQLSDGQCVLGGDNVRRYPTRTDGDNVLVDLADPPPDEIEAAILGGLQAAFAEQDYGRICREVTRLKFNGLDPIQAVRAAIDWAHDRLEFGSTHAFAGTADWLDLYGRFDGDWDLQLVCLAESVEHMSADALRHKRYPYATSSTKTTAAGFDAATFLAAVESEDRIVAETMIHRAAGTETPWDDLESAFTTAALAHYNDFGHSLIYVFKTRQIIERLGPSVTRPLSLALARLLCNSTREDLIPQFRGYAPALEKLVGDRESSPLNSGESIGDLPPMPFPSGLRAAFEWLTVHFDHESPGRVFDAMMHVLAKNLLYYDIDFDAAWDKPVSQSVGWLSLTHGITFANACRVLCETYPHLWPQALTQMACFVGRNAAFLNVEQDVTQWFEDDTNAFFQKTWPRLLDHGLRAPIFAVHLLKTTVAVEEEIKVASSQTGRVLVAGLNRFLNSPIKQKHSRRLAKQAIDLVKRDFE
ncbi:MAG: Rieske (2Fe-2S) protein [Planctomycetota bacterium]|nr:Rieske (2Fe-2S) protein [Planctomycetota bacterium]